MISWNQVLLTSGIPLSRFDVITNVLKNRFKNTRHFMDNVKAGGPIDLEGLTEEEHHKLRMGALKLMRPSECFLL